jgi:membrane fusion protein (multidrug efflux system)
MSHWISNNKSRIKMTAMSTVVMLLFAYLGWELLADKVIETNIAYVEGERYVLSSAVKARVEKLVVAPGDVALEGDILVSLDEREWQQAIDDTQHALGIMDVERAYYQGQLPLIEEVLSQQAATSSSLRRGLETAKTSLRRQEGLGDFVVEKDKEDADMALSDRQRLYHESKTALQMSLLQQQEFTHDINKNMLRSAQLRHRLAYFEKLRRDYHVTLPEAVQVHDVHVSEGVVVNVGEPLLTVTSVNDFWLTAYFKETELAALSEGTYVDVVLDAYPEQTFSGEIVAVSRLAGAALSASTPNYSAGNFTRIIQRIPVTINFRGHMPAHLAVGLSARVSVSQ